MEEKKNSEPVQQLPEDFRPVIPEPEVRRKSIIPFSKNYPVEDSPTSTHTMSFAQEEARRRTRRAVIYAAVLALVFVVTFIVTDVCIKISKDPIASTAPPQSVVPFASQSEAEASSAPSEMTEIGSSSFYVYSE